MTLMYKIFNSENEGAGATVIFSDQTIQQISQDNANFGRVVQILTSTPVDEIDEVALLELLIPALGVGKSLNRLSERVAFDGANILFDGDVVNDAIADHILRIVKEGGNVDSYKALVAFMEKLYTNPSESSRNSLYDFIVRHKITIDPDGDFYAYKGVKADGGSIMEGFGIVDGVSMNGSLPNKPGSILEIPRSKVNADNAVGCGTGLHAGTYDYASGWARGLLLLVKINPRDVVSVPSCSSYQKLRTCRYKVISQTTQQTSATTFTAKVDTALNSINALDKLTKAGAKVPATFTYTRGNGEAIAVKMTVSEIRKNHNGENIVIGEDANGETRSYRATYISELVITRTSGVINPAKVISIPVADTPVVADLRTAIENGELPLINFNYTTVDGEPRTVQNFEVSDIRAGGWRGHELLVGEREDGATRTYRLDRVTGLVVQAQKAEAVSAPVVAPVATVDIESIKKAVATSPAADVKSLIVNGEEVLLDFSYVKKSGEVRTVRNFVANGIRLGKNDVIVGEREDGKTRSYILNRMSNIVILDEDVAPVVKFSTSDTVVGHIKNGFTVTVDFDYTTVAGEARTLKNFKANNLRLGSYLLVGEREDGEERTYRIDRIENIVITEVS